MDKEILETIEDRYLEEEYKIKTVNPEFTCLCPDKRDQPDFAVISIIYVPRDLLIELKSLKYYFVNYRDVEIYHETATNKILEDLVDVIDPLYMKVIGDWNVRGGITTIVETEYRADDWGGDPDKVDFEERVDISSQGKN